MLPIGLRIHNGPFPSNIRAFNFCLGGSVVKTLPANAGDSGSVPGPGRSLEKETALSPVFLPGESHGYWSLVGYSP